MNSWWSLGGVALLALIGLYFIGKATAVSMSHMSRLEKEPQAVPVVVKPAIYTILSGICFAAASFLSLEIDLLNSVGVIIVFIFLGIGYGLTDYWKLKKLVALNKRPNDLPSVPSSRDNLIFRILSGTALFALLSLACLFASIFLFPEQLNPTIVRWGLGISVMTLFGCGILLSLKLRL